MIVTSIGYITCKCNNLFLYTQVEQIFISFGSGNFHLSCTVPGIDLFHWKFLTPGHNSLRGAFNPWAT